MTRQRVPHLMVLILALLVASSISLVDRTYFSYLGLTITASSDDVVQAYRAKKDKLEALTDETEKTKKLKLLNQAYETLSNNKERQKYERYGKDVYKMIKQISSINRMNPEKPTDSRKPAPFKLTVPISIVDNFNGTVVEAQFNKDSACQTCKGTGAASPKDLQPCKTCGGKGFHLVDMVNFMGQPIKIENSCPVCKGSGKNVIRSCGHCKGTKLINKDQTIKIKVPAGTLSGSKLHFTNMGPETELGAPADFEITILETPTKQWSREGFNLIYKMEIGLEQALLGFQASFYHLNGELITIDRADKSTTKTSKHTVKGKGLVNEQGYAGNLLVRFEIIYPKFSNEQLDMWEDFFALYGQ